MSPLLVADAVPASIAGEAPATVAEAVHAATLASPKPLASNTAMLDKAAPETVENQTAKQKLIAACQSALGAIRGHRIGMGPLQGTLIGRLAELLLLKPTNKELAEAMAEEYTENVHGVQTVTVTVHTDEYVDFGADRDPANPRQEVIPKYAKDGKTLARPNPYAQAVRKYKTLAMVEARIAGKDTNGEPWDFTKVADGIKINSVLYMSPVAALMSGDVTMEAVFVAWTNILQPRIVDFKSWSTSRVTAARAYAPKATVVVRKFDKKMNREARITVKAVKDASCLYGLIMGLIEYEDETNPVRLGRHNADRIIAAINAKVDVATEEPRNEA